MDYLISFLSFVVFIMYIRNNIPLIITFKGIREGFKIPTTAYGKAACYDLYTTEDVVIPSNQWRELPTGIAFAPWPHFSIFKLSLTPFGNVAAKIYTRSGLALKKGQRAHLGVIDNDYRGEITVIMFNHNSYPVRYHPGDKVAQIEFYRVPKVVFWSRKKLSSSARGSKGFGSSDS